MLTTDLYTALTQASYAVRRYDVNVTLTLTLANTARGTSAPVYRLTAKGNGIGAAQPEGYGPTPESATAMLARATREAWQAHRAAAQARALARSQQRTAA